MSEDPIGFRAGDVNLYRYVGNSPVIARDPSGNNPAFVIGGALAGGAVGAFSGVYNSGACSVIGKIGDGLIGAGVGALSGALAGIGASGAGSLIGSAISAIGGSFAGAGIELINLGLPSFSGYGCSPAYKPKDPEPPKPPSPPKPPKRPKSPSSPTPANKCD